MTTVADLVAGTVDVHQAFDGLFGFGGGPPGKVLDIGHPGQSIRIIARDDNDPDSVLAPVAGVLVEPEAGDFVVDIELLLHGIGQLVFQSRRRAVGQSHRRAILLEVDVHHHYRVEFGKISVVALHGQWPGNCAGLLALRVELGQRYGDIAVDGVAVAVNESTAIAEVKRDAGFGALDDGPPG